jgi:alpha-amylase
MSAVYRYLMVDMTVNFAASLSTDTSEAALRSQNLTFKKPEHYHPFCWINYGSQDSIEKCWMGDSNVPLMDLNTENLEVQNTLNAMIKDLVTTYQIDGLRIDGECHDLGLADTTGRRRS